MSKQPDKKKKKNRPCSLTIFFCVFSRGGFFFISLGTVELGYGTPYLLSLGIPKTLTPLVWLAGPLSGLIIQPVVGVFSDSLDWRLGRRRPFILIGAAFTILSMYMVAYAKELALLMVDQSSQLSTLDSPDDEEAIPSAVRKKRERSSHF